MSTEPMSDRAVIGVCVLGLIGLFCLCRGLYGIGQDAGYRAGQIDAQTGKVRWHLATQPDGEVVWREKE